VGERSVLTPGESGAGTLESSALEQSNVDIATQFINLVLYQRGYQANAQTLNVANEMMRDTISLMR
jgi:flagellar hook protein FlgE